MPPWQFVNQPPIPSESDSSDKESESDVDIDEHLDQIFRRGLREDRENSEPESSIVPVSSPNFTICQIFIKEILI